MIHRAIYGTLERFTGNLIEHFAGAFPVWLAPEQVRVIPISDAQAEAARGLAARLKEAGLRAHVDDRHETLNYRIREGEVQKVPYMAVSASARPRATAWRSGCAGRGRSRRCMTVEAFLERRRRGPTRAMVPYEPRAARSAMSTVRSGLAAACELARELLAGLICARPSGNCR